MPISTAFFAIVEVVVATGEVTSGDSTIMVRVLAVFFIGVVLMSATPAWTTAAQDAEKAKIMDVFAPAIYQNAMGKTLPYRLLRPQKIDPKQTYPLVLFLHGIGERGTDNAKQLQHGVFEFAKPENRQKYPCFVVAPQCPINNGWIEIDRLFAVRPMSENPTLPLKLALELVEKLAAELPVDGSRIYMTGLSMGGFGTWDAIARRPDFFAAALPVCGGGDVTQAPKLTHLPIWTFHGDKDITVLPSRTITMIEAIRKAGGKPKMTIYPGVNHFSWQPAYADPDVMAWLFAQKK
jgi:predicted peptidase